jgi:hypothetical protein
MYEHHHARHPLTGTLRRAHRDPCMSDRRRINGGALNPLQLAF